MKSVFRHGGDAKTAHISLPNMIYSAVLFMPAGGAADIVFIVVCDMNVRVRSWIGSSEVGGWRRGEG